jgi:hypothetical protein
MLERKDRKRKQQKKHRETKHEKEKKINELERRVKLSKIICAKIGGQGEINKGTRERKITEE